MPVDIVQEITSRLVDRRLKAVVKREYDWVFSFEGGTNLAVNVAWRLVEAGRNAFGSQDDGHQFGLPAPVDGVARTQRLIGSKPVKAVSVRSTGDLTIDFDGEIALEIIQTSCGYEAWELHAPNFAVVAQGGGQLAFWRS